MFDCEPLCVEMEPAKGRIVTLPDELERMILAKVPFPYVFKAKALSKSWLGRFAPISSEDDEDEKRSATSFREEVGEWSSSH